MDTKKIIFTGGGSAGHVTPNLTLIQKFLAEGWQAHYIGSRQGIEKDLIAKTAIPYHAIFCGKLRRYFSWQNFIDPFKIISGALQSFFIIRKLKPAIIFSKGGFVAFPVVAAGWLNRVPVIAHESDLVPGLANKLSFPFVKKICLTFSDSIKYFKHKEKTLATGTPVRPELFAGKTTQGLQFCGFNSSKKIIMVIGGGLGADSINQTVRELLPQLLKNYQVVHLCGKGKTDSAFNNTQGYIQFEYVYSELADVFACADIVISRAGANSIYEILALHKPHILIPLSKAASRGDQIINARYFAQLNLSQVIYEEELNAQKLLETINWVNAHEEDIKANLRDFPAQDSTSMIYNLIQEEVKRA